MDNKKKDEKKKEKPLIGRSAVDPKSLQTMKTYGSGFVRFKNGFNSSKTNR